MIVKLTQQSHNSYIPQQNATKNGVLQQIIVFMWMLSRLHVHTNRIFHCKTLKNCCFSLDYRHNVQNWCFTMDYRVCMILKSTFHSHKPYILLYNASRLVFCNGFSCDRISSLCDCYVNLTITQLEYSIVKRLINGILQWISFLCDC